MIWEGVKKFQGKPFQVIGVNGPDLMFPGRYAKMVGGDKRFSFDEFIEKDFFPSYPGFEGPKASIVHANIMVTTIRTKLTQSLGHVTGDLCDETEKALHDVFGENPDWQECAFNKLSAPLVARLSTRVFLGPILAANQRWLEIAVSYTINMMITSRLLRQIPHALRPFVYRFVPGWRALRKDAIDGRKIISAEIERRRSIWEENKKLGISTAKTADSLGWFQEVAGEQQFDQAGCQLSLTFAAIHTTGQMLSKALFRLAENVEWQKEVREEMVRVLRTDGWQKTSLYKMKLLDSFLKEVHRFDPGSTTSMHRVTKESVALPDGTVVPKGAQIKVLQDLHMDPVVYSNPEVFDPARYLKMRSQPGQENNWQWITVTEHSLGFGYGKHACPGRFFASNEVKIALCWMLIKYDWELAEPLKPKWWLGSEMIPDAAAKLRYRRREEEIDLSTL
ncbi:cytochrome P450 [Ascodesmis nigricans]|uniref:Cytochrome P450 n=1 Tax=Ascodesmis nigricans TaxID=341454 RepID=A0A4S2MHH4_9PEZI|nr:cytochrome P450 [Ascodesmis nigricans]